MSNLSHKKSSFISIEPNKLSGWSDAQVMKLTQRKPKLIFANVETALKPRMRSLQDMGFSDTEIVQLVSSCPTLLLLCDIQLRINFWRSLLGSNERLLKACKRNMFILTSSLARNIEPSISLLREHGISDERIAHMVVTMPGGFGRIDKLKEVIKYIEELGVPRDSGVYTKALNVVITVSRSKFDAMSVTLMSFGWSQPDIIALIRKCPTIWTLSKKNICDKMTFLMKEAGCELTYIIGHPMLLTYNLEKRLRPRYDVMNFLDQKKLLDRGHDLLSVVMLPEEKFRNKFLFLLCKEKFIAQYESYVVAVQLLEIKLESTRGDLIPVPRKFFPIAEAIDDTGRQISGPGGEFIPVRPRRPPVSGCVKPESTVKLSSTATATAAFSLAKGGKSGGMFLRRAPIAAAFSTENGGCCGFLSVGER
ncbi:hypothetical protein C4D60_Mb10t01000 [Musa balbisiana]|uniref:Uncharacterized protein n=1 Tax=Musa balbisiana TaxID=52838 RepID=A0A4S8IV43_MUSBA|nr:hypothetical protein C4D60_Mb10t01000 [Musa balbisiana]